MGVDSLEIHILQGVTAQRVGMLWDELSMVSAEGEPALRRVYRTENSAFGPTLDSTFSRWSNLTPLSHRSDGRQSSVAVSYHADSVLGRRSLNGSPERSIRRALTSGIYDGASFDLLVRAAPLAPKYELTVPGYVSVTDTIARLSARVVGSERIRLADGAEGPEVWRVEMDFAGLASTMWIAKADRRMVRQTIRLTPQLSMLMVRPGIAAPGT